MAKKNNPGCGCCFCPICADHFNRDDDTDIDTGSECGWTEVAGAAEISSSTLLITSNNTFLRCTTDNPDSEARNYLRINVKSSVSGEKVRLILAEDPTAGDYYFAELTFHADYESRCVSVGYHDTGGSETIYNTASAGTPLNTYVRFDAWTGPRAPDNDPYLAAQVGESITSFRAYYAHGITMTAARRRVGIASGASGANITIRDFTYQNTYQQPDDCNCREVQCGGNAAFVETTNDAIVDCAATFSGGSESYSGNALVLDAGEQLLSDFVRPTQFIAHSYSWAWDGTIHADNVGDVYELIFHYVDSNNYWYIEIEITASAGVFWGFDWSLVEVVAGTPTTRDGPNADGVWGGLFPPPGAFATACIHQQFDGEHLIHYTAKNSTSAVPIVYDATTTLTSSDEVKYGVKANSGNSRALAFESVADTCLDDGVYCREFDPDGDTPIADDRCDLCNYSRDVPSTLYVTVADAVQVSSCSPAVNTTFAVDQVLPRQSTVEGVGNICDWKYTFPAGQCYSVLDLQMVVNGNDREITVSFVNNATFETASFRLDQPAFFNCSCFEGLDIPFLEQFPVDEYDFSGSTLTLSSSPP